MNRKSIVKATSDQKMSKTCCLSVNIDPIEGR